MREKRCSLDKLCMAIKILQLFKCKLIKVKGMPDKVESNDSKPCETRTLWREMEFQQKNISFKRGDSSGGYFNFKMYSYLLVLT